MLHNKRQLTDIVDSDQEEEAPALRRARLGGSHNQSPFFTEAFGEEDETENVEQEDAPVEQQLSKILAFYATPVTLAAAFFDPETRRLQILEDTKDTWGWDLALLLAEQFMPDTVLISENAPVQLLKVINEFCEHNPQCQSFALPSRKFHHTMATYHLSNIRLPRDDPALVENDEERSETGGEEEDDDAGLGKMRLSLLKLGCRVSVDAPGAVSAAGALVEYLLEAESHKEPADAGLRVEALESMDIEEYMLINQDALSALSIMDVESHASMHNQQVKHGFCLDVTPMGRRLFHTWLLRPLVNVQKINRRLDAVEQFSSKDFVEVRNAIRKDLRNVKNMVAFCLKIKSGRGTWRDWQGIVETITAAASIKETVTVKSRKPLEVLNSFHLTDEVKLFLSDIVAIIDWDRSRDEKHICVRPNVDEELDRMREDLAGLEPILTQVSVMLTRELPPMVCSYLRVQYLPQLGCLIAVHGMREPELIPADWDAQFTSENMTFFKSPQMINLDKHFGDLENIIMDREIEWIQRLVERLDPVHESLMGLAGAVAEIDCLLSLAEAVDRFGFRRPKVVEEPILKIRNGWHPLYSSVRDGNYIPNDTMLSGGDGEYSAMMVLTGANGSGKSAYGKQVALIVYLAQIGCFVPADKAEIGVCDKIFTRIQTQESASKTASAFMIDLGQVSQALRGATPRSLVILDEFGKGTTSSDGAGLLAGVLTYLLKGPNPRSIVMTHFHELFAQQFLGPDLRVLFCYMECLFNGENNDLTYMYKVTPGIAHTSNAAECALLNKIAPAVVDRAREISHLISTFQMDQLVDAQLTAKDVAELELHEALAKRFLRWEIDEENRVLDELRELLVGMPEDNMEDTGVGGLAPGEGGMGATNIERAMALEASLGDIN